MNSRNVEIFLKYFANDSVSIVVPIVLIDRTNSLKTGALIDVDERVDEHE